MITSVASVADIKAIGRLGRRTLLVFVLLIVGTAAAVMPFARITKHSYGAIIGLNESKSFAFTLERVVVVDTTYTGSQVGSQFRVKSCKKIRFDPT